MPHAGSCRHADEAGDHVGVADALALAEKEEIEAYPVCRLIQPCNGLRPSLRTIFAVSITISR